MVGGGDFSREAIILNISVKGGAIIRGQAINRETATVFEEIRLRWFSLT